MPIIHHLGPDDLLRCRFALSPLWETQEAVRTLTRPTRHGYHLPWLRYARRAAAGLDLTPLKLLMPAQGYSPDFIAPPPSTPLASFAEELATVRSTPADRARDELARALACTPGAAESAVGRAMLADPAAAVRSLADLLERAWRALVEPYWPRLRAVLDADIAYRTRRLADGGLARMFADLHPRLSWADGTLTLSGRTELTRTLGGEGLVLMPSVFCWPDAVSGFEPPWQATVVYPARGIGGLWGEPDSEAAGRALARLLGRGRAAVLGALGEPASTSALAHRLGMAPSSVSAHLTVLREAGLLTSRRDGHRVLYERTPLGSALVASGRAPRP